MIVQKKWINFVGKKEHKEKTSVDKNMGEVEKGTTNQPHWNKKFEDLEAKIIKQSLRILQNCTFSATPLENVKVHFTQYRPDSIIRTQAKHIILETDA